MKPVVAAAVLALLLSAADGKPVPKNIPNLPAKSDIELLQGIWQMVSQEALGVQQAPLHILTIKGNDIFSVDAASKQTFKIDPAKNPKTIDLIHDLGTPNEVITPGIYKLQGDIFTYCRSTGKDRPTEFKTTAKGDGVLMVLKRNKK